MSSSTEDGTTAVGDLNAGVVGGGDKVLQDSNQGTPKSTDNSINGHTSPTKDSNVESNVSLETQVKGLN